MLFGNLALVKMGIIPTRLSRVKVGISLPLSSHNLAINLLFSAMTLSCLGCKEAQIFSLFSASFGLWHISYHMAPSQNQNPSYTLALLAYKNVGEYFRAASSPFGILNSIPNRSWFICFFEIRFDFSNTIFEHR